MKKAIFALVVLALLGGNALADVPDPAFCTVTPWDGIGCARGVPCDPSHPGGDVTITVMANVGGMPTPINAAHVVIEFSPVCDDSICVCDNAQLEGDTNALGVLVLAAPGGNVAVGGCCSFSGTVTVWAGDDDVDPPTYVAIRSYDCFISPDFNHDCQVSLADFAAFAAAYGGTYYCADYNGDGVVSLADFAFFASTYGCFCTPA